MTRLTTENIVQLCQRALAGGGWEIQFQSHHAGMHHQLYANGRLTDWTDSTSQRSFFLAPAVNSSQIVIAAVSAEDRGKNLAELLPQHVQKPGWFFRQNIACPQQSAPGAMLVLLDDHAGQAPPSVVSTRELWPSSRARYGLGQSRWGTDSFGFGGSGAPGLGQGALGAGRFGFDEILLQIEAQLHEPGLHLVSIGVIDRHGNATFMPAQAALVLPQPAPVKTITPIQYDPQTSTLTLHIE